MSFTVALSMLVVSILSKKKVSDEHLLSLGLTGSIVSYTLLYLLWRRESPVWHFALPVIGSAISFAFMGAPTRSIFTAGVNRRRELDQLHGTMQAALSMAASVAGFTVPVFVTRYCLVDPLDVGTEGREMSAIALFAPMLDIVTLLGVMFISGREHRAAIPTQSDETPLLGRVQGGV